MINKKITNILLDLSREQVEAAARMIGVPGTQLQDLLLSPEWKTTMMVNIKETLKKLVRIFAKVEDK